MILSVPDPLAVSGRRPVESVAPNQMSLKYTFACATGCKVNPLADVIRSSPDLESSTLRVLSLTKSPRSIIAHGAKPLTLQVAVSSPTTRTVNTPILPCS